MRRLKGLYPEYADRVLFFAVGFDPSESIETLERYRQRQGYPWPVAYGGPAVMRDFGVLAQTTKVVLDRQGRIAHHGRGVWSDERWRRVLQEVAYSS